MKTNFNKTNKETSLAKFEKFSNPNKYDVTWVNRNFASEKMSNEKKIQLKKTGFYSLNLNLNTNG